MDTGDEIKIGSLLDGYKIEKVLGRGGMGVVYKGHELTLNRKVAIKVLSRRLCADSEFVERFKREARVIAALNHPNIVHILSYGESGGLYYFTMEYVQGRDLGQILKEKRRLPVEEALSIVSQVAGALSDAGSKGVVHRDLKPSNIMVDEMGRVKVTDFGVAHFQGAENRLTQVGFFLGTPEYASPEQAMGKELDIRSDIYALGAVLYSMLSGSPPFTGPSPLAVVTKIATEPMVPIRRLHPELPKPVCDLIDKMMARDIDKRFQTPLEVMKAVDKCLQGLKIDTPQMRGTIFHSITEKMPSQKSRTGLWGGILGVALAVVLVVLLVEGGWVGKKSMIPAPTAEEIVSAKKRVAPIQTDQSEPVADAKIEKPDEPLSAETIQAPEAIIPPSAPMPSAPDTKAVKEKAAEPLLHSEQKNVADPQTDQGEPVAASKIEKPDETLSAKTIKAPETAETPSAPSPPAPVKKARKKKRPEPSAVEKSIKVETEALPPKQEQASAQPIPTTPLPVRAQDGALILSGKIISVALGIINPFGNRRAELVVQDETGARHTVRVGRATTYTPHRTPAAGDSVSIRYNEQKGVLIGLSVTYQ